MTIPLFLRKGDRIRIVAPAGKVKADFILKSTEWLVNQGYDVVLGKHVLDEYFQYAGNDQSRLGDLQEALDDPETSVIICARGGYGTARISGQLDFSAFLRNPKWLAGFSDITVLHNQLNGLGVASLHAAMPRHFFDEDGNETESLHTLMKALKGEAVEYSVPASSLNRTGRVEGELVGGNLSILYSLRGTPLDLKFDGEILFIEDISEYLYHIDRMMQNLKLGGVLERLAGLVVGDFTDIKDNPTPFGKNAYEIIREAVEGYNYPVCFGFPAGHNPKNMAMVLGAEWMLEVEDSGAKLEMK